MDEHEAVEFQDDEGWDAYNEAEMHADGAPLPRITDLMGAEVQMERLAVLEARRKTVEAHVKEVLERKKFEVDLWKKAQLKKVEREMEYRKTLLAGYLDEVGEKSVSVVAGRFRFRKVPEKLKVVDDAAARGWVECQENPDTFLSKPKVRTVLPSALQKHLKAMGEIPDGCEIEPEGRKFEVDLT